MNASASTTGCSRASADDGSDADNPPERTEEPEPAEGPPARVEVLRGADAPDRGLDLAWLRDRLEAALTEIGRPVREVAVSVVGDGRIRELNRAHRGTDEVTDVLAFSLSPAGKPIEADLVINADVAEREAAALDHSVERELLLYALHGVLHCAGFEDETSVGFEAMHAEEDRILEAIGVGPTFARDGSGHDKDPGPSFGTGSHNVG